MPLDAKLVDAYEDIIHKSLGEKPKIIALADCYAVQFKDLRIAETLHKYVQKHCGLNSSFLHSQAQTQNKQVSEKIENRYEVMLTETTLINICKRLKNKCIALETNLPLWTYKFKNLVAEKFAEIPVMTLSKNKFVILKFTYPTTAGLILNFIKTHCGANIATIVNSNELHFLTKEGFKLFFNKLHTKSISYSKPKTVEATEPFEKTSPVYETDLLSDNEDIKSTPTHRM